MDQKNKKRIKKKKPPNPLRNYTIHSRHNGIPEEKDVTQYLAFDPGENNPEIRIERRIKSHFGDTCSSIITLYQCKHRVNYQRELVTPESTKSYATLDLINILEQLKEYYVNLDMVLIERQMNVNNNMMHFQWTVITYFVQLYPDILVIDVLSKLKSHNLGVPPDLNYPKLKKWGTNKAIELSKKRKDKKFLKYLDTVKKIDDACDTLLMIEGFCAEIGYQLS